MDEIICGSAAASGINEKLGGCVVTSGITVISGSGSAFVHTDSTDDTESEISGKVGVTVAANEDLGIYGELAGISSEDSSGDDIIDWTAKIGAKFTF